MYLRYFFILCVATALLSGCGDLNQKPEPKVADTNEASTVKPAQEVPKVASKTLKLDIGDVESYIQFKIVPAPESLTEQVKANIIERASGGINLVTLDVYPPYPQALWLDCNLHATHMFTGQPVVLRGIILRDEAVIGDISGIMGVDQVVKISIDADKKIDALFGLGDMPDSILIHGETEALLMPVGTDTDSLDTNAPESSADAKTLIMSNPVRINFLKEKPEN